MKKSIAANSTALGPFTVFLLASCAAAGCGYTSFGVSYRADLRTSLCEDGSLGRWGADIALAGDIGSAVCPAEVRYFIYHDRHGEFPQALYATIDLAPLFYPESARASIRNAFLFPTLKPLAGVWHWVESPHNSGILTGLRAGVGRTVATGASTLELLLEYGVLWLGDTLDDGDTEMRVVSFTVTRRW